MISPRIKKNTQSGTVKHKSRRNDDGGEEEEAEEEKYVEALSFICKNVQMYWHSDESALRTQIRNTHRHTHAHRTYEWVACSFDFIFSEIRCCWFSLGLLRFTLLELLFFSLSLDCDYATHTRLVCAATVSQLRIFIHIIVLLCTSNSALQLQTNSYIYICIWREQCSEMLYCIVYITYYTIPYTIHNWGDFTS